MSVLESVKDKAEEVAYAVGHVGRSLVCAAKGHDWGRKSAHFKPATDKGPVGGHQRCERCGILRFTTLTRQEYEEYRERVKEHYCTCGEGESGE